LEKRYKLIGGESGQCKHQCVFCHLPDVLQHTEYDSNRQSSSTYLGY
jgi:wyosine [tRNA(Phe)-imidazoG37] synthetase (radical SAM superfamily)